jgi:hypothetical protein
MNEGAKLPIAVVVVPLAVAAAFVLFFALRGGGGDDGATRADSASETPAPGATATGPAAAPAVPVAIAPEPVGPDVAQAGAELERALRRQRLWSTIELAAPRIDVRSALCDDPAMSPAIAAAAPGLRGAGLTRLRCLAQSGAVVFERDL